jgi:DNA-binding transcriptional ArsR family regulator
MNYSVSSKIDLRFEALCVLERLASGEGEASGLYSDCDAYCDHYLTAYALPETDIAYIGAVRDACRHVAQHHAVPADDLKKYFKPIPETDTSLAGLLMFADRLFAGKTPAEEQCVGTVLSALEAYPDEKEAQGLPKTILALSEYLAGARLPDVTKWACIDFCLNYEAHMKRAFALLDSVSALIAEKAEPLEMMAESCARSLRALCDSGEFETALRKKGLTLDTTECEIVPCAMRFSAVSLHSTELDGAHRVLIRYGVRVDELTRLAEEQRSAGDEILRYVKAMGDKTRMQILLKLKEAPQYGQDIVAFTGLTAATVSHHMSELVSAGLITLEKQGTRILYRLCAEKVERLIALLQTLVSKKTP